MDNTIKVYSNEDLYYLDKITLKKDHIHVWKIFWNDIEEYVKEKCDILSFRE